MAGRNPAKGIPWFKHDTGYVSDEDIEVLIANYGQDGYAYPLHMYELAYNTRNGELSISDAEKKQVYAKRCLVTPDLWEKMTQTALKYGIWDREAYENRQILTSNRIKEQMRVVFEHRENAKNLYESKKAKAAPSISDAEKKKKKAETTQSRVEESIKEKDKRTPPPEALRLAGVLAAQILRSNPDNRELRNGKKETSIQRWAKDIDDMLRLDNRKADDIQRVILWAHQESTFWYKNILSGGTLRKKFDRMLLEMVPRGTHKVADESGINYEAVEKSMAEKTGHGQG